jgi:hypothetical protein
MARIDLAVTSKVEEDCDGWWLLVRWEGLHGGTPVGESSIGPFATEYGAARARRDFHAMLAQLTEQQ